jgi:signal transduction histidine kinase/HAMP domain-containing protein
MSVFRRSIGAALFGAFLAMSAIIALQGYYGFRMLSAAGDMVVRTFDGPLMAVSYARAADFDFVQIERKLLQRAMASPSERAAIDSQIDALTETFVGDLKVAEDRSPEVDELREIGTIKALVRQWTAARHAGDAARMEVLEGKIDATFDLLIEFNTDHGFVGRRKAVDAITHSRYVLGAGLAGSLLFAFLIAVLLTRRIARPLSQAASVADRIAAGEFETPIPSGGPDETGTLLRSMTVMQDNIRAMVGREAARAASAEVRLSDALETSGEGVMVVGADGNVAIVNSRLRSFFPQAADALVPGTSFDTLVDRFRAGFLRGRVGGALPADSLGGEYRLPDGRWVRIAISPTSDDGRVVLVSDFTDIKRREQTFKQAKRDAEAASAAKSRFLANMSHELRTPLNAIIGFSEMLSGQVFGTLGNPRYVEYAKDILHSGRHLLDVINSVLDLSKNAAGKMELRAEQIDLAGVLQGCVRITRDQCSAAGLDLVVSGLDRGLPVRGESARLHQVFLNLLSNAIKFTERGGCIELSARDDGEVISVVVADTGIGMSAEDIQIALTPFGQVDNRLERKYEGTGLGLPLAKGLIELHGGALDVKSAVGHGTRVTVSLPRSAASERQAVA